MILSLRRTTRADPDDHVEHLEVDDGGRCTLWRSAGWATMPVTPVGRFERELPGGEIDRIRALVGSIDGDLATTPMPDATLDTLRVGAAEFEARLPARAAPDGPWLGVVETARALLVGVTSSPVAALDLAVDEGGIVLRHLGTAALAVSPSEAWVRAEIVDENGSVRHEWPLVPLEGLPAVLEPGWTWADALAGDAPPPGPADRLRAFAALALIDGDTVRTVSLESRA